MLVGKCSTLRDFRSFKIAVDKSFDIKTMMLVIICAVDRHHVRDMSRNRIKFPKAQHSEENGKLVIGIIMKVLTASFWNFAVEANIFYCTRTVYTNQSCFTAESKIHKKKLIRPIWFHDQLRMNMIWTAFRYRALIKCVLTFPNDNYESR